MLYLGCPIWTSKTWNGTFFPADASSRDALTLYSRRLQMVEGNTTFYALPSQETVLRWREETPDEFRFCLKFPRIISHDYQLVKCEAETGEWLDRLQMLGGKAGPSFLQLPRDFAPDRLGVLARYLQSLPSNLPFAVEPRHSAWFLPPHEDALNQLLVECGMARVIYDGRPLRAADSNVPIIHEAQQKKPQVPVRAVRTAPYTLVRYISHPDVAANVPWLNQWKMLAAKWLQEQTQVYFCMHSISEADMPVLCRRFHEDLSQELSSLAPLPEWQEEADVQMSLF